ncbi:MAG: hypothetical protein MPN21_01215 [Thermoanaerobaculia bacterium]|nr:hypothetical protein [Thermoanaerobaculia bacterium]
MNGDEFYIGWEERASPIFGRHARFTAVALVFVASLLAFVLAASQSVFDEATFEFGQPSEVEGVIRLIPHPVLEVATPSGEVDHWLLVAFGKHGADEQVAAFEGEKIRLQGTLIYRGSEAGGDLRTMVEIVEGSVQPVASAGEGVSPVSLGRHTLRGEIVDSKCWLGVMKPGYGKTHRACASLCIRGGIPPLLAVHQGDEVVRQLLLLGAEGEEVNQRILHAVAEPIEVTGEVFVAGDVWTLHADLDSLVRLTPSR